MWKTIRTITPRLILPILVVIATVGIPIVPSVVNAQDDLSATPVATSTPADTPMPTSTGTPEPTATPTSAIFVEPSTLTIYGQKSSIFPQALPTYQPAQFSVYTDTDQAEQLTIFHPSLNSQAGEVRLVVDSKWDCYTIVQSVVVVSGVRCYSILPASPLSPGEYKGKLYVDLPDQEPKTVDIVVRVGVSLWWLLLLVALGVVAAEFLAQWNGWLKHKAFWLKRRDDWLDLLTENDAWVNGPLYGDDPLANSALLQLVKTEIRSRITALRDWLKKGREGGVRLADIPVSNAQNAERIFPLKSAVYLYLDKPEDAAVGSLFDRLAALFHSLREAVSTGSSGHLQAAIAEADQLYGALDALFPNTGTGSYVQLKSLFMSGALTDEVIKTAWEKMEAIRKSGIRLKTSYVETIKNQMSTDLPRMAELCVKLIANAGEFKTEILEVAKDQLAKVNAITATPAPTGKAESAALLGLLNDLAESRERWMLKVTSANEPLCYLGSGTTGTGQFMDDLEKLLTEFDQFIDDLDPAQIAIHARVNFMLRGIREHLKSVDDKLLAGQDEAALAQAMNDVARLYAHDRRFFRLGREFIKLSEHLVMIPYLKRAYNHLLEGKLLDAEIEIKRGKRVVSDQGSERARGQVRSRWEKIIDSLADKYLELSTPFVIKLLGRKYLKTSTKEKFLNQISLSVRENEAWHENAAWRALDEIKWLEAPASLPKPPTQTPGLPWLPYLIALVLTIALAILPWFRVKSLTALTQNAWSQWLWWIILIPVMLFLLYKTTSNTSWGKWLPLALENPLKSLIYLIYYAFMAILAQALTIAVATALVVVTNLVVDKADTWGSSFDILAALVWGAIANRVASPLKSGWETLIKGLSTPAETKPEAAAEK